MAGLGDGGRQRLADHAGEDDVGRVADQLGADDVEGHAGRRHHHHQHDQRPFRAQVAEQPAQRGAEVRRLLGRAPTHHVTGAAAGATAALGPELRALGGGDPAARSGPGRGPGRCGGGGRGGGGRGPGRLCGAHAAASSALSWDSTISR
ncbi:hypothetical protein SDC9_77656 [bioreactor metagenome]|uniref:Uncharacterized protein n=1 Tax=bioreactor metagenome TaxID=1076179 RepID=A0A644YXA6_9ZZZZ